MSLTCFQTAPVNLLEERLVLQRVAAVIFEAQAFGRVLCHQPLTDVLAHWAELRRVGSWIVNDPASHLTVLNLDKIKRNEHFHHAKGRRRSQECIQYLLPSDSKGAFGFDHLIQSHPQSEVIHGVVVLLLLQQFWSHETCRRIVSKA